MLSMAISKIPKNPARIRATHILKLFNEIVERKKGKTELIKLASESGT